MGADLVVRRLIDNRSNVGRQPPWIAHLRRIHRTVEHVQKWLGDIFLQIEHPQRRATLAGTEKGRLHDQDGGAMDIVGVPGNDRIIAAHF